MTRSSFHFHSLPVLNPTLGCGSVQSLPLPNFVLAGANKSATTYIHWCLKDHPDVFMPEDEIPYFEDPDYQQQEFIHFAGHFLPATGKKAVGIKRPDYLSHPEVPARLARDLPGAKIVLVLRDPLARLISHYFHFIYYGFLPVMEINRGLTAILEDRLPDHPRASQVISDGLYAQGLSRYLKHFDRQRLLVLLHDSIEQDPLGNLETVCRFLNIDPEHRPATLHQRPQAAIYSPMRLRWLRLKNRYVFEYFADGLRVTEHEPSTRWGRSVVRFVNTVDRRLLQRLCPKRTPVLNESLRRALADYYRSDVHRLETLLNCDLSHWRILRGH